MLHHAPTLHTPAHLDEDLHLVTLVLRVLLPNIRGTWVQGGAFSGEVASLCHAAAFSYDLWILLAWFACQHIPEFTLAPAPFRSQRSGCCLDDGQQNIGGSSSSQLLTTTQQPPRLAQPHPLVRCTAWTWYPSNVGWIASLIANKAAATQDRSHVATVRTQSSPFSLEPLLFWPFILSTHLTPPPSTPLSHCHAVCPVYPFVNGYKLCKEPNQCDYPNSHQSPLSQTVFILSIPR
jgi:hypothetical protein